MVLGFAALDEEDFSSVESGFGVSPGFDARAEAGFGAFAVAAAESVAGVESGLESVELAVADAGLGAEFADAAGGAAEGLPEGFAPVGEDFLVGALDAAVEVVVGDELAAEFDAAPAPAPEGAEALPDDDPPVHD